MSSEPPPPRDPRWRPGMLFGIVLGVLALAVVGWLLLGRGGADPVSTPNPTQILQPPPSAWDQGDLTPPSTDAQFTEHPVARPDVGIPDPARAVSVPGGARAHRIDASTAMVLSQGRLQHVNLADGAVNWAVEAAGRVVVSPGSGAVVEVAPDGSATSRVVLTGEELSRGALLGEPVLCGDVLFDIGATVVNAHAPTDLGSVLWSAAVDGDTGLGGAALQCREEGRHLLIGEMPAYRLRITPATHEVTRVEGLVAETVAVEMGPDGLTLRGAFGQVQYPARRVLSLAEGAEVVVTVEEGPQGGTLLRGYGLADGAELWEVEAGDVATVLGLQGHVLGVSGSLLVRIEPQSGALTPFDDLGGPEVAPDAHGNVCGYGSAEAGRVSISCVSADGRRRWNVTLDGDRVQVDDGIWQLRRGGEALLFQ